MRVLIAEDDAVSRRMLESTLVKWGYEVVATGDGRAALKVLQEREAPKLAILDWMMPEMDGLDVCRHVRALHTTEPTYIVLLTAKGSKEDIITGLNSGADDFLTKPFDHKELQARLRVGIRMVEMQKCLADRVRQIEEALSRVKQVQGLLPICCYCKKIRTDQNFWQQVEAYISVHTDARFSHGICPECMETVVKAELKKMAPSAEAVSREQ
jgi:DNA-binding response OmpR family regulator